MLYSIVIVNDVGLPNIRGETNKHAENTEVELHWTTKLWIQSSTPPKRVSWWINIGHSYQCCGFPKSRSVVPSAQKQHRALRGVHWEEKEPLKYIYIYAITIHCCITCHCILMHLIVSAMKTNVKSMFTLCLSTTVPEVSDLGPLSGIAWLDLQAGPSEESLISAWLDLHFVQFWIN